MSSLCPRLPAELVDSIISCTLEIPANINNTRMQSAYVLVGRQWRNRINAQRYRNLSIYMTGHRTAQLQALADICTSTVWNAKEGVAFHVQTFNLQCGILGITRDATDTCDPEGSRIRDAAIVDVLGCLFRDKSRRGRGVSTGLSLGAGYHGTRKARVFRFATLGHEIIAALDDLVRTADIERLTLKAIWGVPWSFLSPETLRYLYIDQVKFLSPNDESVDLSVSRGCLFPNLAYIHLNDSPSFVMGLTSQVSRTPPPVTTMEIAYETQNYDEKFWDILNHVGGNLESLTIKITGEFYDLCTPIDYRKVHVRDHFSIDIEYSIYDDEEEADDTEQIPAFETMVRLLPPTPAREMHIVFAVSILHFDPPHGARGCIEDVFPGIYAPSFPEYLERVTSEAPGTIISVVLNVSVHVNPGVTYSSSATKEHRAYLLDQFACLSGMNGVTFRVDVYEHHDLHMFRLRG
ncbi:hypothetical protein HYPSUDRAFT_91326 [Hypholoma sublateritium FD-334 SS-4]|uniref:F-box domain-containing protein n=1 Tax=Hypholoma sublateritium (strain FD-334 SS-4) TaxID=945553 RepID=A0A0D2P7M4_HYPSF|nr:hypothetical protein HYPSUDRAFT_91326 [Hypholoma sublateritium FD-334 SS-4]